MCGALSVSWWGPGSAAGGENWDTSRPGGESLSPVCLSGRQADSQTSRCFYSCPCLFCDLSVQMPSRRHRRVKLGHLVDGWEKTCKRFPPCFHHWGYQQPLSLLQRWDFTSATRHSCAPVPFFVMSQKPLTPVLDCRPHAFLVSTKFVEAQAQPQF